MAYEVGGLLNSLLNGMILQVVANHLLTRLTHFLAISLKIGHREMDKIHENLTGIQRQFKYVNVSVCISMIYIK